MNALIPADVEVKIVKSALGTYCVDVIRPAVLRISPEIERILRDGIGKSETWIRAHTERADEAIRSIVDLQAKGFLVGGRSEEDPPAFPVQKIALEVTRACNLRCLYCYVDLDAPANGSPKILSLDLARKAVDFFCHHDAPPSIEIDFFGGEPLIAFNLIKQIVHYCGSTGRRFEFCLTTNATLVTPEIADYLQEHHFGVAVSLDGLPAVHNHTRPLKNGCASHEAALRGMKLLREAGVRNLTANAVVTKRSADCEKIASALTASGVKNVSTTVVSAPGDTHLELDPEAATVMLESEARILAHVLSDELPQAYRYLPFVQFARILAKGVPRRYRCAVGREMLAVGVDGDIYPCHRFIGNRKMRLGSVLEGIDEAGRRQYGAMNSHHWEECRACWARNICGGPCISDSYQYYGAVDAVPSNKCQRIRSLVEQSVMCFGDLMTKDRDRLIGYLRPT